MGDAPGGSAWDTERQKKAIKKASVILENAEVTMNICC